MEKMDFREGGIGFSLPEDQWERSDSAAIAYLSNDTIARAKKDGTVQFYSLQGELIREVKSFAPGAITRIIDMGRGIYLQTVFGFDAVEY